jgi:hypothetical protein
MDTVVSARDTSASAISCYVVPAAPVQHYRLSKADFTPGMQGGHRQPIYRALFGRIAPGWNLVQPLFVMIELDDDGSYIASDDLFAVYGVGDTSSDALQDYAVSLIDYYDLIATRAEGDTPTLTILYLLQRYICKSDSQ